LDTGLHSPNSIIRRKLLDQNGIKWKPFKKNFKVIYTFGETKVPGIGFVLIKFHFEDHSEQQRSSCVRDIPLRLGLKDYAIVLEDIPGCHYDMIISEAAIERHQLFHLPLRKEVSYRIRTLIKRCRCKVLRKEYKALEPHFDLEKLRNREFEGRPTSVRIEPPGAATGTALCLQFLDHAKQNQVYPPMKLARDAMKKGQLRGERRHQIIKRHLTPNPVVTIRLQRQLEQAKLRLIRTNLDQIQPHSVLGSFCTVKQPYSSSLPFALMPHDLH
jgi:hypothetical protein